MSILLWLITASISHWSNCLTSLLCLRLDLCKKGTDLSIVHLEVICKFKKKETIHLVIVAKSVVDISKNTKKERFHCHEHFSARQMKTWFWFCDYEMVKWERIKHYGNYGTFAFLFFFVGVDYAIHLSGMYNYFIVSTPFTVQKHFFLVGNGFFNLLIKIARTVRISCICSLFFLMSRLFIGRHPGVPDGIG